MRYSSLLLTTPAKVKDISDYLASTFDCNYQFTNHDTPPIANFTSKTSGKPFWNVDFGTADLETRVDRFHITPIDSSLSIETLQELQKQLKQFTPA